MWDTAEPVELAQGLAGKTTMQRTIPNIQTVSGLVVTENMKHKVVHILNLKHLNLESKRHSQLLFPVTRGLSGQRT